MTWIIDAVAFVGGGLVVSGVYLQWGLPVALMTGGAFLVGMALHAAKQHGGVNVSNA